MPLCSAIQFRQVKPALVQFSNTSRCIADAVWRFTAPARPMRPRITIQWDLLARLAAGHSEVSGMNALAAARPSRAQSEIDRPASGAWRRIERMTDAGGSL
jgi:hypothetical protein